jgi:hypothetical protein
MDHVYNPRTDLPFSQADRDMLRDTSKDVKAILRNLAAHSKEDDERFKAQGRRIGRLETWHTRIAAVSAFVGAVAGIALPEVAKLLLPRH